MVTLSLSRWCRQRAIKRWRAALAIDEHLAVYQQLFITIDGFTLSRQARANNDAPEYVYGEIEFIPFIALLSLVKPDSDTIFYDLGSGTGKGVLACAMVFNVKKSCGIELFSALHHAALKQQERLHDLPNYLAKAKTIHFIKGDFLCADFNDATLVFINATALFGSTWDTLNDRLTYLTTCRTVITTSKRLTSRVFMLTKTTTVQMSWGVVKAYIQTRLG